MTIKKKIVLLLTLSLLILVGCQKFSSVKIEQQNNELLFNFSSIGDDVSGDKQYILYDISVSKNNCTADSCVIWEVIRKENYFDSLEHPLNNNSVLYGSKIPAMKTTTPAKTLSRGEHIVTASVGLVVNGEFHKSFKILQKFNVTLSK